VLLENECWANHGPFVEHKNKNNGFKDPLKLACAKNSPYKKNYCGFVMPKNFHIEMTRVSQ